MFVYPVIFPDFFWVHHCVSDLYLATTNWPGTFFFFFRLCFLQADLSLTEWVSDSSCTSLRTRSSTFIVSESLFPIKSHGEYYLKVPFRVLVESTHRVTPTHYPRWHPYKSQPVKSKSQSVNTKVSRQLAGQERSDNNPGFLLECVFWISVFIFENFKFTWQQGIKEQKVRKWEKDTRCSHLREDQIHTLFKLTRSKSSLDCSQILL